jgi:DNA-binding CsgD family transcriptional regulator
MTDSDQNQILADLVAQVGDAAFAGQVMQTFHGLCAADMCSGFAIFEDTPQALFAGSIDPRRSAFARIATLRYVQKYWKRDTATASILGRAHRSVKTIRRPSNAIRDLDYRHECYAEGEVIERISICKAGAIQIIANAYRARSSGPFSQTQIERFEAASPIVMAAIEKHLRLTRNSRKMALSIDPDGIAKQLYNIEDIGLSLREAQVLAFILSGMDQNSVAREIGVEVSTVVTYRRRGYAKLGARNRTELRASLITRLSELAKSGHSIDRTDCACRKPGPLANDVEPDDAAAR